MIGRLRKLRPREWIRG